MALDVSRRPAGFNAPTKKREFDTLKNALLMRSRDVCHRLYPAGKLTNGEWRVGSPDGEAGKSMGINLATGVWKDFDGGEGGGDLIDLWARAQGMTVATAYDDASAWLGWTDHKPKPAPVAPAYVAPLAVSTLSDTWWMSTKASKRWEYIDADGVVFAIVCRFDAPDGSGKVIRPWDPARADWQIPDGPRPLYNLSAILKSEGPVLLVEGEKCADALIADGFTATTILGGANAAAKADWSPLKGRAVIRWADNDHPVEGKTVASDVWLRMTRAQLEAAGVRSVHDVAIPAGKPDGWDAADADKAARGALIGTAATSAPAFAVLAPFALSDWGMASAFVGTPPVQEWLVKDTIPLGSPGVFAAPGGAGKSMMLMDLAFKICLAPPPGPGLAIRDQAFGHDVMLRGSVVLLMAEDDRGEIHRRLEAMDQGGKMRRAIGNRLMIVAYPDAGGAPYLIQGDDRDVSATLKYEELRKLLLSVPNLVFVGIDPLSPFVGGDLNKPHIGSATASLLCQLSAETGATVCTTHHMSKGDRSKPVSNAEEARHAVRGAAAIVDGVRWVYALWQASKARQDSILHGAGRTGERNAVFQGALVKYNTRVDDATVTYLRDVDTGVLKVIGSVEIAIAKKVTEAKEKALPGNDDVMSYLWALTKYRQDKGQSTKYGVNANILGQSASQLITSKFQQNDESELEEILLLSGLKKKPSVRVIGELVNRIVEGKVDKSRVKHIKDGFEAV